MLPPDGSACQRSPWCMVGRKRLQTAMDNYQKQHGDVSFEIKWKPFRLNPDLPQDDPGKYALGCACTSTLAPTHHVLSQADMADRALYRDKMQAYIEKFGKQRVQMMLPRMEVRYFLVLLLRSRASVLHSSVKRLILLPHSKSLSHAQETFAGEGEKYNFSGLTGSTLDSHRLAYWAGVTGGSEAQDRLMMQLFKAYFTQARLPSEHILLCHFRWSSVCTMLYESSIV